MHPQIQNLIRHSLDRILPTLTPHDLALRLSRRCKPLMTRPPRPCCIAIRANDTRLPNAPRQPSFRDPDRYIPAHEQHTLTITSDLVHQLALPKSIESMGEPWYHLAKKIGASYDSLITNRITGFFSTRHVPLLDNRRGHPVPILNSQHVLDPGRRSFHPPDPLWTDFWQHVHYNIPTNIRQILIRVPNFVPRHRWDLTEPRRYKSRRLPPPEHDFLAAQNPRSNFYRVPMHERQKRNTTPHKRPQLAVSSILFRGWKWLCPACKKTCATIYFPLTPLNFAQRFQIPTFDHIEPLPQAFTTFACYQCHRIQSTSRIDRSSWNRLITYCTAGLLYGHEVPTPIDYMEPGQAQGFSPGFPLRKRQYSPQKTRKSPRRDQVLRRLLNGWSIPRIARDMQVSIRAVLNHVRALCDQENVPHRHALLEKLNSPHQSPFNQDERATARRFEVLKLLLAGQSYKQIMQALSLDFSTLNRDTQALYRAHNVKGYGQQARQALAKALNIPPPPTHGNTLRHQIRELRQQGQTWPQIAKTLHMTFSAVDHHAKVIRREDKRAPHHLPKATLNP